MAADKKPFWRSMPRRIGAELRDPSLRPLSQGCGLSALPWAIFCRPLRGRKAKRKVRKKKSAKIAKKERTYYFNFPLITYFGAEAGRAACRVIHRKRVRSGRSVAEASRQKSQSSQVPESSSQHPPVSLLHTPCNRRVHGRCLCSRERHDLNPLTT